MYNTDKTPTNEDLAIRLVDIADLKDRWQDITKNFYGDEVATLLKEVAPADPYILYDLSAISLINEGISEQEAIKTVDSYTHKEWLKEFKGFKHTLTKSVDKAYKMYLRGLNERTSERLKRC